MRSALLFAAAALVIHVSFAQPLATRGDASVVTGNALTVATAGAAAAFTISAKDESGNARTSGGDNFVVALDGIEPHSLSVVDNLNGLHTVSYVTRTSGSAQLSVALAQGGGLWASYFENIWFFYTPVLERVDPQIDFDWGSGAITQTASDYVSVRWTGRVRTLFTEAYTFYADADDGVRLWVDGQLLIDRWDNGANMTAAKVSLAATRLYSIKVEYKDSTGAARMSLYWSSPSTLKEVIPASQLFYEVPCKSSPWSLSVVPAAACAAKSVSTGPGLASAATAGVYASFNIDSLDQFSNAREVGGEIIAAHLYPSLKSARAARSDVSDNKDGTYFAVYRPVTSGSSSLGVQFLTLGGLFATMYTDTGFTQSISTVEVTSIDYTKTATPYISAADPSNDALFSIRYAGFFKASVSGMHTFQVVLAYLGENYALYVDNFLAIDASSGAINGMLSASMSLVAAQYYGLELNYISSSASAGNRKVKLDIINPSTQTSTPASSADLYRGSHVLGSPFSVSVSPARLCAALSTVSDAAGDSLSIATAGLSAVFSITARDVYGNLRSSVSNNTDSFRISLSGVSGASGTAVSNPDGTYRAIYSVTQSGTYDLSVVFGSAPMGSSPYKIWAQPAGRLLKNSPVRGSGLSLLTAGIQATVTITIRDAFSNGQPLAAVSNKISISLGDATNIAVAYCSSGGCPSFASGSLVATPVTLDNPRYVASFTVTKAGNFSLAIYGSDSFDTHVMGSPFQLTVLPAVFYDSTVSDLQPSSSVAGFPSYFNSQTFDAFGNVCYSCTQALSVFTRLAGRRDIIGTSTVLEPSRYNASYTATKSGSNALHIVFGTSAGIMATYYPSSSFGDPRPGPQLVPDIDFSVAASSSYQGISGVFSARYAGLFKATLSGMATFKIAHKSTSDSWKLTLSNVEVGTLPVSSAAATTLAATIVRIEKNQLYEIKFEYISSNADHAHGISFAVNTGFGDAPITSQTLFASRAASVSPITFTAAPGTVCASLLTRQASGFALSIVTAGGTASFTVQSRDLFGNTRTVSVDDGIQYVLLSKGNVPSAAPFNIQASVLDGGREAFFGTVQPTSGGGYSVKYSATLFGVYQLSGRVQRPGGLYGLYFETDNLQDHSLTPSNNVASQPTFQRLDSQINFRWGLGQPVDTLDSYFTTYFSSKAIGPDFFSVRWYGSVLSPLSEVFTFSAEADDGVRLYVDNLLIINQWDFKSGVVDGTISLVSGVLYSIKLEYKESINNATIVLMWSSRSLPRAVIPSSSLYYTITSGPISSQTVYVPPASACHAFSSIYGPGLTVATAGIPAYFTIQSLDSYGNHRLLMDSPYFYVRLSPITSNTQLRPYKSQFNGLTSSSGLTSSMARVSNPLFNGGLTATYYSSNFANGYAVSCQHVAWVIANGCGGVDLASFASSSNLFTLVGLGTMAGTGLIARWSGYFQPTSSGLYRFYLGKSSGTVAGLSMSPTGGGSLPLVSLTNSDANPSATVSLVANAFYEVTVQFTQNSDLVCKLQYAFEPPGSAVIGYASTALVPTSNLFPLAARYRVMYTAPTVRGDYSTEVSLAVPGVLDATFYDDVSFDSPKSVVTHTHVHFTSTSFASNAQRVSSTGLVDVGYGAGINVSDFNSFSVRWKGFFKATQAETTFSVLVREADERVRLWVDNLLLINSWEYALSPLSFSATFGATFADQNGLRLSDLNSLFDIKLEYVQFAGESGISVPLFTAANVFAERGITIPPPFPVHPAVTCAARSVIRGTALTRATAGVPGTFTVMALDMYRNDRDVSGDFFVSRLHPAKCEFSSACPTLHATVTDLGDSTYAVSYLGTKKGSYELLTSLALPSALTASYFPTANFAGTASNVFKTYSASFTMPASTGGIRYAGFIRPPVTGPVTLFAGVTPDSAMSIWFFDSRIGVTATSTITSSASGSSVMNVPTANALYEVRVDLSTSSAVSLTLSWQYDGIAAATMIPTSRVFARTDVPNTAVGVPSGPFSTASLMMVAGGTCAAQCLVNGAGLTVSTAATAASFMLTARDEYANDRGLDESSWVIKFNGPSRLTAAAFGDSRPATVWSSPLTAGTYASVVGPGRYSVSYQLTVSGTYSVDVLLATSGGLKSEYYCNSWLSGTPCYSSVDPTVDFNWGLKDIIATSDGLQSQPSSNFVSVRWSGYFLWETSETVTFYTQTDEGTRLYMDGVALIDQWHAMGSNFSATWSGSGVGGLYSITMEYRESTDIAYCRLLYSSASAIQQPIPNALLFSSADHIFGSPFSMYSHGVSTCVATSAASLSPSFTLYTVGTLTSISITTRDQYSNLRTSWDAPSPAIFVRSCAADFSDYCKRAAVKKSSIQGVWTAVFSATRAAATNVLATLVYTGGSSFRGMHATYYNSLVIGSQPFKTGVVAITDSSLSSNTRLAARGANPPDPQPFSIRWVGVFVASTTGQYTFSFTVQADDAASLYVNNIKVAEAIRSGAAQSMAGTISLDAGVNAFYDIVLNYQRSVSTDQGSVTLFQYQCCASGTAAAFATSILEPLFIPPLPVSVKFATGPAVIHNSDFNGMSLSISTAGNLAQFTVTSRDSFGNRILSGGETMYLYVSKADGTVASATVSDSQNGIYVGSYVASVEGAYVISVALGSAAKAFSMTVFPSLVCASKCITTSSYLTVSTAGYMGSFTVTMRDAASNFRTSFTDDLVVKMLGPFNEMKNLPVSYFSNAFATPYIPTYQASYRTTASGNFSIDVRVATSNGLNASFFIDPDLSQLVLSRIDSTLSHDWGSGSPDVKVAATDMFSAQWSGFVKPDYSGEYTFATVIADVGDRVRLWVDDQFIINLWDVAPAGQSNTATIKLSSNTLYDIKLQYRDTSGNAAVTLTWERNGAAAAAIPSQRLISSTAAVAGSPFTAYVFPAFTCGSLSTASGHGLSLATAGVPASFTITAIDHLGNRISHSSDIFTVRARHPTTDVFDRLGTVTAIGNGLFSAVYTPTLKRNEASQWHDVPVSLGIRGASPLATYYQNSNGAPIRTETATLASSGTPSDMGGNNYNARYSFFVQPPTTTWALAVGTSANGLSVKVDGKQLLTSVAATTITGITANALYDVEITMSNVGSGSPAITIALEGTHQSLNAVTSRVFQRHDLAFRTFDSSGLLATFYSDTSFSSPVNHATMMNIDWSYAANTPKCHSSAPSSGQYSVRWKAFFRPTMPNVYTFYFQKSTGETAVSLALDNGADVAVGNGATEGSATVFIPIANQLYEITLKLASTNSAAALFRLLWLNEGNTYASYARAPTSPSIAAKTVVGSDSLFRIRTSSAILRNDQHVYYDAGGLPDCGSTQTGRLLRWYQCRGSGLRYNDAPNVEVRTSTICGSLSSVTSAFVSLSTAGTLHSFSILTRDIYNNIMDGLNAAVTLLGTQQSGVSSGKFYGSALPTSAQTTAEDPKGRYTVAYTVSTVAGNYLLNVGVADSAGNGLRGVYFSGPSLGGTVASNQVDALLNFSWGAKTPSSALSSAAGWSARWTGFVRLSDSASSSFTFYLRTGAGGGRVYVANALIVDSTSSSSAGEVFGTTVLQNNVVYDVIVEYIASAAPALVQLSYSSASNPKQILPSSNLYPFSGNLIDGARTLAIKPNVFCGALSLKSQEKLSIATAGVAASFKITTVDQYGNFRVDQSAGNNNPDCSADNTCKLSATVIPSSPSLNPVRRSFQGSLTMHNTNNFFNVQYTVTAAGNYLVAAFASPSSGGLFATYYDDLLFAAPKAAQLEPAPGWTLSSTAVPALPGAPLVPDGLFSVRLGGAYRPTSTGSHTFSVTHSEQLSLYVDGVLLIDQKTYSGNAVSRSGVISFPAANAFYEIVILYSSDSASGSQLSGLSIIHNGNSANLASSIFASVPVGAATDIVVLPNVPCGTRSTIKGYGLSVATAGTSVFFSITVRDEYYNLRTHAGDHVVVRAFALPGSSVTPAANFFNGASVNSGSTCPGCPTAPIHATITAFSSAVWTASLILTVAGNYKVAASLARRGGLSATFYAADHSFAYGSAESNSRAAFASLDFSSAGTALSGRWSGFIHPSHAGVYTFTVVPVSASNEFMKLWISQTLIIDRTTTIPQAGLSATFSFPAANALYDIFVAYSTANGGFGIFWEKMGAASAADDVPRQSIPTSRLFNRDDVVGDTYYALAAATVFHASASGSKAIVTGFAAILTAGLASSFTISSRDAYSNVRTIGNDFTFNSVSVHSSGVPVVYGTVTYAGAGSSAYNAAHSFTITGQYSVHIRGGGLHVLGSPFTLTLLPAQECSATSLAFGAGLTVTTVNVASSFYVQTRDAWGNVRTLPNVLSTTIFVARAFTSAIGSSPETTNVAPYAAATSTNAMQAYWQLPSWYVGSYQLTAKPATGHFGYFRGVSLAALGGFLATYYHNLGSVSSLISSGTPLKTAVDRFDNTNTLPGASSVYAARWSGFIRSTSSGAVVWTAFTQSDALKGKIWVNGGAAAYGSPAGNTAVSAAFTTVANTLYHVVVECRSTSSVLQQLDTFGANIVTSNMYADFALPGAPAQLAVY